MEISFERGEINSDELIAGFYIEGDIPWSSRDCNGNLIPCNDPVVQLFIAVGKQYRNIVPLTLIPPSRKKEGVIECIVVGNCAHHQNNMDSELRKYFEKAVNKVFDDMEKYLREWGKTKAEQYSTYYEISEYNSCDEVIESFIKDLSLHKAPPMTKSMLSEVLEMATDSNKRSSIEELFKTERARTLALLQ